MKALLPVMALIATLAQPAAAQTPELQLQPVQPFDWQMAWDAWIERLAAHPSVAGAHGQAVAQYGFTGTVQEFSTLLVGPGLFEPPQELRAGFYDPAQRIDMAAFNARARERLAEDPNACLDPPNPTQQYCYQPPPE